MSENMLQELELGNAWTIAVGLLLCLLLLILSRRSSGLPPGPRPWPIVGNTLLLGKDRLTAFRKLRDQYGDIFTFYMGSKPIIMVNGFDAIKGVFDIHGDITSGRLGGIMDKSVPGLGAKGILNSDDDLCWQKNREFAIHSIHDSEMGKKQFQTRIHEEIRGLIQEMGKQEKKAFDVRTLIINSVANVICSIAFGKRFGYNDNEFMELLSLAKTAFANGKPSLALAVAKNPVLNKIPSVANTIKQLSESIASLAKYVDKKVKHHEETFDGKEMRSMVDLYLNDVLRGGCKGLPDSYKPSQEIRRVIFDIFLGGMETTSTALNWTVLYLINYPELQASLYDEIVDQVGGRRLPRIEDKDALPKVESMCLEVLRHAAIVPLSARHKTTAPLVFGEHRIPTGSVMMPIIDSVLKDEKVWDDPFSFKPQRFIVDGVVKVPQEFIPFGIGRRRCTGDRMAQTEMFLYVAALLQHFQFLPENPATPPPIAGVLGITHEPLPFVVRIIPRTR